MESSYYFFGWGAENRPTMTKTGVFFGSRGLSADLLCLRLGFKKSATYKIPMWNLTKIQQTITVYFVEIQKNCHELIFSEDF